MIDDGGREGLKDAMDFAFFILTNPPQDPTKLLDIVDCDLTTAPAKWLNRHFKFTQLPILFMTLHDAATRLFVYLAWTCRTRPTSSRQYRQGQYSPAGWWRPSSRS